MAQLFKKKNNFQSQAPTQTQVIMTIISNSPQSE